MNEALDHCLALIEQKYGWHFPRDVAAKHATAFAHGDADAVEYFIIIALLAAQL